MNIPVDEISQCWFSDKETEIETVAEQAHEKITHLKPIMYNLVVEKIAPVATGVLEEFDLAS